MSTDTDEWRDALHHMSENERYVDEWDVYEGALSEALVECELCTCQLVKDDMIGNDDAGYICRRCEQDEQHEHAMTHRRYR